MFKLPDRPKISSKPLVSPLESAVKRRISRALERADHCWYYMPVQTGYGRAVLDYIACIRGQFVVIETKRDRGKLTPRQIETANEMTNAGALVYVIRGTNEADCWAKEVLPYLVAGDLKNATNHYTLYREGEIHNLPGDSTE